MREGGVGVEGSCPGRSSGEKKKSVWKFTDNLNLEENQINSRISLTNQIKHL